MKIHSRNLLATWSDGGDNLITELCGGLGACCTGNQSVVRCRQQNLIASTLEVCSWGTEWSVLTCILSQHSCLGDINVDGEVSTNDLLTVIANWGPCP